MFCPKCGAQNAEGAKFCVKCGTPMPTPTAAASAGTPVSPTMPATPASAPAPAAKSKKPLVIGIAAAAVAVVLLVVFVVIPGMDKSPFKGAKVGDVVQFGSYEQDGNVSNGTEPIEWQVLAVDGKRAFVISKKAIDATSFNSDIDDGNDWETSELKSWLESDFVGMAFSQDDLEFTDGLPTLLSKDEVEQYLPSSDDRLGVATPAIADDAFPDENHCEWWLRTPGSTDAKVAVEGTDGEWDDDGVSADYVGVRPAMWVQM